MGGSAFGKQFGKITTKIVDPFGINKTQFGKTVRKVIDPLNIMDPLNVLPGQGEKWGTLDKNYGGPLMNWISPKQSSYVPMTKGLPSNAQYFQQQQQMLQNLKASSDLDIARRKASNAQLASSKPLISSLPTQENQVSNQVSNQVANQVSNQPSIPPASNLAQTKISDTNMPSDLPMEFSYKPPTTTSKIATANTFSLPNMSDIKFGGA
jgi:hypothetical protein